jgi:hypothetical protein
MNLVTEKQLENSRKGCEIIHREVECGREPVASCAQVVILAKCQKGNSDEQMRNEKYLRRTLKISKN